MIDILSINKSSISVLTKWAQCYKILSICNLLIFVISQSVCRWQVFRPSLMLVGKSRSLPYRTTPEKMFHLGRLQPYSQTYQTNLEKLARNKHSSLLRKFVNYGLKQLHYSLILLITQGVKVSKGPVATACIFAADMLLV